jgi:uncharacterized protein YbjQ (UPF0145 family)
MKTVKRFSLTRAVTKNIVVDSFQWIRNIFGLRLRGYERMLTENTNSLMEEMNIKYPSVIWWRLSVNPLSKGSAMIVIYGEYNE